MSVSIPLMISRLTSAFRQRVPYPCRRLLKGILRSRPSLFRQRSRDPKAQLGSLLEKTRREVDRVALPAYKSNQLDDCENTIPSLSRRDVWTSKQRRLYNILNELRPGSVLDIGNHTTWYAKLAALLGSKVVSFDRDSNYVTHLYYEARAQRLPILPLVMDFTDPTPARGIFSHRYIAATERFQCDMVLALPLAHELVFERHLHFDHIVEGAALFSKRWLVVEFVPREDPEVSKWWSDRFSWYTLDNFIDALRKRFRSVRMMPSHPEHRVILLCDK